MPLNQPESMLVTPHTVSPIVSPMVLMIGTTMRFPGAGATGGGGGGEEDRKKRLSPSRHFHKYITLRIYVHVAGAKCLCQNYGYSELFLVISLQSFSSGK